MSVAVVSRNIIMTKKTKKHSDLLGALVFLFVIIGLFFVARGETPYLSELAYIEHSILGQGAGSVVPASCDSSNPLAPGSGSSSPGDCVTPCPSGVGTYDPYYDQTASTCPPAPPAPPVDGVCNNSGGYECTAGEFDYSSYWSTSIPAGSYQWYWYCNGINGGSRSPLCSYAYYPPPTATITGTSPIPYGGSSTLTLKSTNATTCGLGYYDAAGTWHVDSTIATNTTVSKSTGTLTSDRTYYFTCDNGYVSNTGGWQDFTVTVNAKPTSSISLSGYTAPYTIPYGSDPGFILTSTNASSCYVMIDFVSYPSYLLSGTATSGTYYNGAFTTAGIHYASSYCYNSAGWGPDDWTTISFTVDPPLQLCRNIWGTYENIATQGGSVRFGLLILGDAPVQLKTYLNGANDCSGTNVTAETTFAETASPNDVITVTDSNPKTVTATMDISPARQQSGTERVVVSRGGVNIDVDVDVLENCVWDCALTEKDHCSNKPPYTVIDSCEIERSCAGKRYCDYNWKEVAP